MVALPAFRLQLAILYSLIALAAAFIPFYGMEDYANSYHAGPKEVQGPYRSFGSPMNFKAYRSPDATNSPTAASKRTDHRGISGHMLKQPLLKFDVLWRKFGGNKRFEP